MAKKRKTGEDDRTRISRFLDSGMKQFEKRLQNDDFKPTVGDYLKLMQAEQELERDEAKEIKVTWVDQEESES